METTKTQKCKKYTNPEKAELLILYQCSGMSAKTWCEENGIGVSTLQKWLNLDRKQADTKVTQHWAAIAVLPKAGGRTVLLQAGKFSIEVMYRSPNPIYFFLPKFA